MINPKNLNKCCPSNDGNIGNAIACIIKIIKQLERENSNIKNNLDTEHFRALDAENTLQLHINEEYKRAATRENELEEALNAEIDRATTREENINNLLNLEIENRIADVDAEETRAKAEEAVANRRIDTLNDELDGEKTIRETADVRLENLITGEKNRAEAANTELDTKIDQEIKDRKDDVDAEEARAINAESALTDAINAEINRVISAETELSNTILNEVSRATSAETVLDEKIIAETNRAISAEAALQEAINAEETKVSGEEQRIENKLDQEVADRIADVNAEEVRAKGAENTLQGNIDAEALARQNADKDITDLIPAEATTINQLADKDFVSQSISTASATFRGTFNIINDLKLNTQATRDVISAALSTAIVMADNNDYAFVEVSTSDASPTEIFYVDKYKYNGTAWAFEYKVNNSGYTTTQWSAINSGINLALVTKLSDLPNNTTLQSSLNTLSQKDITRVVNITSNQSNVTSTITGSANNGRSELVIYRNTSANELTVTISTNYVSSDGSQIILYIPTNGYSEVSYLNIDGTIYVRGI